MGLFVRINGLNVCDIKSDKSIDEKYINFYLLFIFYFYIYFY